MKKFLLPTIKKDSSSPLGRGCPEGTGEGKDNKVSSLIRPPATLPTGRQASSQRGKGMLFVFLFSLFFLLFVPCSMFHVSCAHAATEFVSIVDTGGASEKQKTRIYADFLTSTNLVRSSGLSPVYNTTRLDNICQIESYPQSRGGTGN
ncbi:MAG TPA: hypothetical protein P5262_02230 [Candidatus Moranbacteria bacterium]|nr:hypothetical protein [Candidatus Moranbacteria bacterium]